MFKYFKERFLLKYFIILSMIFNLVEPIYEYFQDCIYYQSKFVDFHHATQLVLMHILTYVLFLGLIFSFDYFFNTKKKSLIIFKYRMQFFLLLLVYTIAHTLMFILVNKITNLILDPPLFTHSATYENISLKTIPFIILSDFKSYIGLFIYITLSRGMLSSGAFFIDYSKNYFVEKKSLVEQNKNENNIHTESINHDISEIFVKKRDREMFIDVKKILYFQSSGNYMEFSDGEELFSVRSTTKDIANRLPSAFIQIHRSSIVNLTKISHVSTKPSSNKVFVSLTNGESFTVSRSYQKEFKDVWKSMNVTHEK